MTTAVCLFSLLLLVTDFRIHIRLFDCSRAVVPETKSGVSLPTVLVFFQFWEHGTTKALAHRAFLARSQ